MLEIEHLILDLRSESLNMFFSYFPLLASSYFYISIIAIGYWVSRKSINFLSLAFLVPYSTLLNCLLKNLFQISRPDPEMHLIAVHDPFGFPSGDVQVATVFWGYIFLKSKHWTRYFIIAPIVGIGISRIYLGVHSFNDVIFGLVIGIFTILLWNNYLEKQILKTQCFKYWTFITVTILVFFFISIDLDTPPMVSMSIGVLIGIGFVLKYLQDMQDYKIKIVRALTYLFFVITLFSTIPLIKTSALLIHISLATKFMFVIILILYVVPIFDKKFLQNDPKNK